MDRRAFLRVLATASALAALPAGCVTARRKGGVRMDGLAMPPFNTTLMGVLAGVLDYYGLAASAPTVFGISGHAFLINIHAELCPSGPYCWKLDVFDRLVKNLGIRVTDLGFYSPNSSMDDRADVEKRLCRALDASIPCALLNLENQLITGYDSDGFFTAQPWPLMPDFPPARLSFGDWREFGDSFPASFYTYDKTEPAPRTTAVLDSLDYAVELHAHPSRYSMEGYGIGPDAYANWIKAAESYGATHGNWWNAMVWAECRRMAAEYFGELGRQYADARQSAAEIAQSYAAVADLLSQVADKAMDPGKKVALLQEAQSREAGAIEAVRVFAATLRAREGE